MVELNSGGNVNEKNQDNTICEHTWCICTDCSKFREAGDDTSCKIKIRDTILYRAELERSSRPEIDISERYGYIYLTENLINHMLYIGQRASSERDISYIGSGVLLKCDIKEIGKRNFNNTIIDWADNEYTLDEREIYWIHEFEANISNAFYNKISGGTHSKVGSNNPNFGNKWSEEMRVRASERTLRRYKDNPHLIDKISAGVSSYFSDDHRRKEQSEKLLKYWSVDENRIYHASRIKMAMNREEVRKKLSDSSKRYYENTPGAVEVFKERIRRYVKLNGHPSVGRVVSEEQKLKQSIKMKEIAENTDFKEKISRSVREYYSKHEHPCVGKHPSEETVCKIRDGNIKYWSNEKLREKSSEERIRYLEDHPDLKNKMVEAGRRFHRENPGYFAGSKNPMAVKVVCVETGEIFGTIKELNERQGMFMYHVLDSKSHLCKKDGLHYMRLRDYEESTKDN